MKKVGDLMKDLGFKDGASEEVTKAFIKNLIKQAYGVEVKNNFVRENPSTNVASKSLVQNPIQKPEQLAFDLAFDHGPSVPRPKKLA